MKKLSLHQANNGFSTLDFEEYDSSEWFNAVKILENEFGFVRKGETVAGMDEGILPSFVKGVIVISAGWDNWSGNYLLSESKEGDEILRSIIKNL